LLALHARIGSAAADSEIRPRPAAETTVTA
jgi:hypothetical protein